MPPSRSLRRRKERRMENSAAVRVLNSVEDLVTATNCLQSLCLYLDGKAGLPVIHCTHDPLLGAYLQKIAEALASK